MIIKAIFFIFDRKHAVYKPQYTNYIYFMLRVNLSQILPITLLFVPKNRFCVYQNKARKKKFFFFVQIFEN